MTDKVSQADTPDYRDSYALSCAPFENDGDPGFFYASTALMQRLDLLTHLTQFGESVILVMGPAGSGKTTLLGSFSSQANNRWQLCVLDGNAQQPLAERLAVALGADAGVPLEEALNHWDAATDPARLLVVAIDNAEKLDQQSCEALCSLLALPQGERLRIVLFGTGEAQPRVKKALQQQGFPQSLQLLEIPRFSEEETASYLMYRLAVAGYSGESPFTATEVRAICKAADGRPAAVNALAHQTLTEHSLRAVSQRRQSTRATARNRGPLWLTATAGLLILVAYAAWQRGTDSESPEDRMEQLAEAPLQEAVPLRIPEPVPPPAPAGESSAPASGIASSDKPGDDMTMTEAVEQSADVETAEIPLLEEPPPTPAVESPETVADQAGAPAREPQAPEASSDPPAERSEQTAPAQAEKPVDPAAAAAPRTAAADIASEGSAHRESWLLAQPADHYSLQLLGSRSEQSINRFIAEHKLDVGKTAYYRGRYKDAEWYVLMYGVYPSRDAALQQAQTLPAAIRKERPWPREMKSVQLAIREAMQ